MIDEAEARRKFVANERIKLSATYANGLAVAIFAVGGFAPLISTTLSDRPHFAPVIDLAGRVFISLINQILTMLYPLWAPQSTRVRIAMPLRKLCALFVSGQ